MASTMNPVRRLVTGINAQGKSAIIEDGPATKVRSVPERPGYHAAEIWVTHSSPVPVDDPDRVDSISSAGPPCGGTVLRVIDFPPEPLDPAERDRSLRATFSKLYPDAEHRADKSPHPGMHVTDTVDYVIVLSGEIYAVLEEGEVLLKAGDVLIQRGTGHAWANRSGKNCRIAFVLIDGLRAGR
jgi:mannose-6-phosphate isomerase-like protein (cupin superfamily)